jgi:streptomycin 6-kinase
LIQYMLNKLPHEGVKELNLDKERLLLWGYCHTVLATSWTVDEETYDVSFYQGIEIFEKLYETNFGTMNGEEKLKVEKL